jgi:chromosome segregation ATPase
LLFVHPIVVIVTSQPCLYWLPAGSGVHGRLADLCKPINRKYSQAISVAAGSRMDHVVR